MAEDLPAVTRDLLKKASRGGAGAADLAEALKQIPSMILLLNPEAARAAIGETADAEQVADQVAVRFRGDVDPDPVGTVAEDGSFGPHVFTGIAGARAHARVHDLCGDRGVFYTLEKSWTRGLHQFLMRGYGGMVIDPESEAEIPMNRKGIAGLFAQYTLDQFAELDRVFVATAEGDIHVQQREGALQAIVFDHDRASRFFEKKMEEEGVASAGVRPVSVKRLLEEIADLGVEELVVNPMLPDIRFYRREDLQKMRRLRQQVPGPAAPVAKPAARPLGPPIARSGRSDDEGRRHLQEWRRRFTLKLKEPWQLTEALAFESELSVPFAPPDADRLVWPATVPDPDPERKGSTMTPVYSSAEAARRASKRGLFSGSIAASGIEALRWIWSAPARTEGIYLDWPEDSGWARIPADWALGALFPASYPIPNLKLVQGAEPAHLGDLPGARALKPELLATLARHWKSFLAVAADKDHPPPSVPYQGGRYLPLFSTQDRFLAYASEPGAGPLRPLSPEKVQAGLPPYRTWLRASAGIDGVLIDPGSPAPLPLGHFDLLVLYLRSAKPEAPLKPAVLVEAVAGLLAKGAVSEAIAGRLLAEWPVYFACAERTEGEGGRLLEVAGAGAVAVFSEQERARAYVDRVAPPGALRSGAIRIEAVRSRWRDNLFLTASKSGSRLRFDPTPAEGSGLDLGPDGIAAALGRLDALLCPRVPEFLEGGGSG